MKYMLLIYSPEDAWDSESWKNCVETSLGICNELASQGQLISASPLHPVASGMTVRIRSSQPLITKGPFAETVEQLGGYYVIDVEDLDAAIAIATRLPPATIGTVEIRPIRILDGLPAERFSDPSLHPDQKKFMLLCYDDEQAWEQAGKQTHESAMQEAVELTHRLDAKGKYINAAPLYPSSIATSVRVRNGKRLVTDGPFAETREVLGGFYVILARDHDEAISIAAQHSGARVGAVEVREIFDVTTLT